MLRVEPDGTCRASEAAQRLERRPTLRAPRLLTLALLLGALASGCAGTSWNALSRGRCGDAPDSANPPGRYDPAIGCIVTADVERACAAHPPEAHAFLVSNHRRGGPPPSACEEATSRYRRERHLRDACACKTAEEVEREENAP
jgi:hypothetical protein